MFAPSFLARDLVKLYGDRRVLDGVDLTARPGQRIGLVGENGVGKSTLLRLSWRHGRATALTADVPVDGDAITARALLVPGRLSLDRVDVPAGGRLLVTGPNGSGKPTLLAVLAGQLAPTEGVVLRQRGLKIGLLAQDDHFPEPTATPRGLYDRVGAEVPLVELGLVAPRDLDRQVGQLSVGQRRRVALALLIAVPPHVLLLDEPTNHLSLALAGELEQALGTAPGAVVIASHDRWLRRGWDGATLALPPPT